MTSPASHWLFAEGAAAGGYETWILLANPDASSPSDATLEFLTEQGPVAGPSVNLDPGTRRSVRVNDFVTSYDVATVVRATGPGVAAERAMYSAHPRHIKGAATGEGATSAAASWVSAEGATRGGYETWLLISNPSGEDKALVDVDFLTDQGPVAGPRGVLIPAQSRVTIRASDWVRSYDVSSVVRVTQGADVVFEVNVEHGRSPSADMSASLGLASATS